MWVSSCSIVGGSFITSLGGVLWESDKDMSDLSLSIVANFCFCLHFYWISCLSHMLRYASVKLTPFLPLRYGSMQMHNIQSLVLVAAFNCATKLATCCSFFSATWNAMGLTHYDWSCKVRVRLLRRRQRQANRMLLFVNWDCLQGRSSSNCFVLQQARTRNGRLCQVGRKDPGWSHWTSKCYDVPVIPQKSQASLLFVPSGRSQTLPWSCKMSLKVTSRWQRLCIFPLYH